MKRTWFTLAWYVTILLIVRFSASTFPFYSLETGLIGAGTHFAYYFMVKRRWVYEPWEYTPLEAFAGISTRLLLATGCMFLLGVVLLLSAAKP